MFWLHMLSRSGEYTSSEGLRRATATGKAYFLEAPRHHLEIQCLSDISSTLLWTTAIGRILKPTRENELVGNVTDRRWLKLGMLHFFNAIVLNDSVGRIMVSHVPK